ncbi:hypothetical protein O6P43_036011 [Quillaja saponaria]|uniref:Uncharacterized protein n=1 Tax=Quillaja saponaria TaxID=32244 RepID=A0AAD7KK22_QUISA|nr:hypothetical protein O6P43_036011 [Quillaja saponaria]
MKNVAKCDTWCELQNPVNHRVFERKLRPRPSGRGHVCLGVTHRCPDPLRSPPPNWGVVEGVRGGHWPPASPGSRLDPIRSPQVARPPTTLVVEIARGPVLTGAPGCRFPDCHDRCSVARNATAKRTPGKAGLPAEFKHINKRRKRNLQGFP